MSKTGTTSFYVISWLPWFSSFYFWPILVIFRVFFLRKLDFKPGMRSRDIFGRLRLRLRLRGSIPAPAPAPAPSKTFRRLRLRLRLQAKCTGSGGSGSGSGSDAQVLIWALTSNTIFKNVKYQNMTSYDLTLSLNVILNECLWNLSPIVIQGQCLTLERSQTPWGCAVWDKWITA